jgi:hypothetical protein
LCCNSNNNKIVLFLFYNKFSQISTLSSWSIHFKFNIEETVKTNLDTECARDRGPYEEKNVRQQSKVCVPGNMIAHRETQIQTSKWARSLNFWRIFKKVVRTKQKKK